MLFPQASWTLVTEMKHPLPTGWARVRETICGPARTAWLTGRELLFQLSNGVPVRIGRSFLGKALLLVERCASAEIDVQTDGGEAYLMPRKCELNEEGKAYIANAVVHSSSEGGRGGCFSVGDTPAAKTHGGQQG
jgi:hypothetical protein